MDKLVFFRERVSDANGTRIAQTFSFDDFFMPHWIAVPSFCEEEYIPLVPHTKRDFGDLKE